MASKRTIDWEAIEREYRAGQLSIREIARQHSLSDNSIRKRAKDQEWERDLTQQVREKVRGDLVRGEVRTIDAKEAVKAAAARGVEVVRSHRADIQAGRNIVGSLMQELIDEADHIHDIEQAIDEDTKSDRDGKRKAAMLKAVSLPTRAGVMRDLSVALKNLIPLERQAFNLDEKDKGPPIEDIKIIIAGFASQLGNTQ